MVLSGGLSHERDVSLRSGRRVAMALRSRGVEVVESDVDSSLVPLLGSLPEAVVFPVLHGEAGEDGALREVLALLGVPFVGSIGSACRVAFDKSIATTVVAEAGHRHPRPGRVAARDLPGAGCAGADGGAGRPDRLPDDGQAVPGWLGLGASKVSRPEELPSAMVGAYAYGPVAVIEQFIEGTEVTVTVADRGDGPAALPAVEIRPESGVYDYESRYTAGATRFLCPAEIEESLAEACAALALTVHDVLGLRDLSRTDLIITPDGGRPSSR